MATPQSTSALNALWVTGYTPTQADFQNLFASFQNIVDNGFFTGIETGITAHAGGGQGSAYALTARISSISTVATAGDSVVLPVATVGAQLLVISVAANAPKVWAATGDTINISSSDGALSLQQGVPAVFTCVAANNWQVQAITSFNQPYSQIINATYAATYTPAVNTASNFRIASLTGNITFAAPTGTLADGQVLQLALKDNGTSRTITWNSAYQADVFLLPGSTTVSTWMYLTFQWNAAVGKWLLINLLPAPSSGGADVFYRAYVQCNGTSAPEVIFSQNTWGKSFSWARLDVGQYKLTPSGGFDNDSVVPSAMCELEVGGFVVAVDQGDYPDFIYLQVMDSDGNPTDDVGFYLNLVPIN